MVGKAVSEAKGGGERTGKGHQIFRKWRACALAWSTAGKLLQCPGLRKKGKIIKGEYRLGEGDGRKKKEREVKKRREAIAGSEGISPRIKKQKSIFSKEVKDHGGAADKVRGTGKRRRVGQKRKMLKKSLGE